MDRVLGIFNRQRLKRFALPPLEMSGAVKKPLQKIFKMHPLEEVLLVAEDYCSWAAERCLLPLNRLPPTNTLGRSYSVRGV